MCVNKRSHAAIAAAVVAAVGVVAAVVAAIAAAVVVAVALWTNQFFSFLSLFVTIS